MTRAGIACLVVTVAMSSAQVSAPLADPFPAVVAQLRPSVAVVGSYHFQDTPTAAYFGTGFVVDDGLTLVTNAHVLDMIAEAKRDKHLRVFFPDSPDIQGRTATIVARDDLHDLAILRFTGLPVEPLRTDDLGDPPQGAAVGMLGYPIAAKLGVTPAVHRGVIAAVVPAVQPLPRGVKMTPTLIHALRNPYKLYQLDMAAFPGNSGSPIFDACTGRVVAVLNKTLAARTREHLIAAPSGVAYAVPARWVNRLIEQSRQVSQVDSERQ